MSIRRVKAGAGVAAEKGLGAEGRSLRKIDPGIAENIRCVVAEMRRAIQIPSSCHWIMVFVGRGTLFGALLPFKLLT